MQVAIIGCGLIGRKRAEAMNPQAIRVCCDVVEERARKLASGLPSAAVSTRWQEVIDRSDVDVVMIATNHRDLPIVAAAAAAAGKHVLMEKPGARRAAELDPVVAAVARTGVQVRIGFNHRYHRALRKAHEIITSGALGPLMFIRGRYGHGGRIGYEKEWRADPELSGGGEAIDQGLHLLDLARWFLGEFSEVQGCLGTFFWNMPVEDNAFFLLRTPQGQVAQLHATWTEWKNLFSFEIYGRDGKLDINGKGGSYGLERLVWYRMLPELGPPETTLWEFPMRDNSWEIEIEEFLEDIRQRRNPHPGLEDAQAALRIVEQLYRLSGRI